MKNTGFQHKGIAIAVQENGEFSATVNGIQISAGSLIAIKKKIDKSDPFEPFDAFTMDDYYEDAGIKRHKIVGVKKDRGRNSHEFITDKGISYRWVYRATKKNLDLAQKYVDLKVKHKKMRKDHESLEEAAKEKIGETIFADDLLKEKIGGQPAAE